MVERIRMLAGIGEPGTHARAGRDLALSHGLFTLLASQALGGHFQRRILQEPSCLRL